MADNTLKGSTYVDGPLSCREFNPPAGSIENDDVADNAGIDPSKLGHQHEITFAQGKTTDTPATDRRTMHVVKGATGTIVDFRAMLAGAAITGNATCTLQCKKNGTNILSADLVLDNANALRVAESAAGFSSAAVVAGDILEFDHTANAGTGSLGQGLVIQLVIREDAQ